MPSCGSAGGFEARFEAIVRTERLQRRDRDQQLERRRRDRRRVLAAHEQRAALRVDDRDAAGRQCRAAERTAQPRAQAPQIGGAPSRRLAARPRGAMSTARGAVRRPTIAARSRWRCTSTSAISARTKRTSIPAARRSRSRRRLRSSRRRSTSSRKRDELGRRLRAHRGCACAASAASRRKRPSILGRREPVERRQQARVGQHFAGRIRRRGAPDRPDRRARVRARRPPPCARRRPACPARASAPTAARRSASGRSGRARRDQRFERARIGELGQTARGAGRDRFVPRRFAAAPPTSTSNARAIARLAERRERARDDEIRRIGTPARAARSRPPARDRCRARRPRRAAPSDAGARAPPAARRAPQSRARRAEHRRDLDRDAPERFARAARPRAPRARVRASSLPSARAARMRATGLGSARRIARMRLGAERVRQRAQHVGAGIDADQRRLRRARNHERFVRALDVQAHALLARQRPVAGIARDRLPAASATKPASRSKHVRRMVVVDRLLLLDFERQRRALGIPARLRPRVRDGRRDRSTARRTRAGCGPVARSIARTRSIVSTLRVALSSTYRRSARFMRSQPSSPRSMCSTARALFVEVAVEQLDRIAIDVAHDRAAVALAVLIEIAADDLEDVALVFIPAAARFHPDRFEIGREAFVEPGLRPIAAGDEIAEPLVRELVRDERFAREIEVRALVVQRAVGLRRRARVLHPAEDEIGDRDLRVARVRVRHADRRLERVDHLAACCRTSVRRRPRAPARRSSTPAAAGALARSR